MPKLSLDELTAKAASGRYDPAALLPHAIELLAQLSAQNAALRLEQAGTPAAAREAAARVADVDSWREGVKFAVREFAKLELCFLTDSMQEVAVRQVCDSACAERDAILAAQAAVATTG